MLLVFSNSIVTTVFYRFITPAYTPLMIKRIAEKYFSDKKLRFIYSYTTIEKVSPHFMHALIAAEDNNFFQHRGFDFYAIKIAREHNKKSKRKWGASTISQQTAKNVFLWPARNYLRKAIEVYYTVLIEAFWSKCRILEVYINIIEMGDGIYGVEAASRYYFKKSASALSRSEAALLAGILPSPRKSNPANPSAYLQRRKEKIIDLMQQLPAPRCR